MKNRAAALRALDRARVQYERQGYIVTVAERLPTPLEGFQADAVARRGDETVIIEIRSSDMSDATRNRFDDLGKIVATNKGWRVDLVTFEPETPLPAPDSGDVVRRVEEARRVADISPDAAVMLTWSAIEGALIDLRHQQGTPRRHGRSPYGLIRELAIDGLLSDAQVAHLDRLARLRSYIIHGQSTPSFSLDQLDWPMRFALAAVERRVATVEDMIGWFHENYETPANAGLLYDSEEGEYVWFDRRPYYVDDVLWEQFDTSLESVITEATETIESDGGTEWAARSDV